MCDYSLELYRSRPAVSGERYETTRFPSGSIGFVSPGDPQTAICMACDTRLELTRVPAEVQHRYGIPETVEVTFARIEGGPYHDGIRLADGSELTLQLLGPGVGATLVDDLLRSIIPVLQEAAGREMIA